MEPLDPDRVKTQFAKLVSTQILVAVLAGVLALAFVVSLFAASDLAIPIFLALIVLGLYSNLRWRCPACGQWFGRRFFFLENCPRCGVDLR